MATKKAGIDKFLVPSYQSPYTGVLYKTEEKDAFEKHLREQAREKNTRSAKP